MIDNVQFCAVFTAVHGVRPLSHTASADARYVAALHNCKLSIAIQKCCITIAIGDCWPVHAATSLRSGLFMQAVCKAAQAWLACSLQGLRKRGEQAETAATVEDAAIMAGDGAFGAVGCAAGFSYPVQAALAVAHDARRPSPLGQIRSTCAAAVDNAVY